ncbi:hypothetical protein SDC9_187117 [bioreactor metagenome]|uniref:Uncharacterized protein n=1 Tax=bioreactor metagenome TaxID=1076179 RepID=A0A645HMW4_9ZZZZ
MEAMGVLFYYILTKEEIIIQRIFHKDSASLLSSVAASFADVSTIGTPAPG